MILNQYPTSQGMVGIVLLEHKTMYCLGCQQPAL